MTLKYHVSHDFMNINTDKKITFGKGVVDDIVANISDFPDLPITMVVLGDTNNLLSSTYVLWQKNGDSAKGDYYNAEYTWKTQFTLVANYVDTKADGDLAIINNSGFDHTEGNSTKSKVLSALVNFKSHGNSAFGAGAIASSTNSYAGLKAYLFTLVNPAATVTVVGNQVTVSMGGVVVFSFILNTKSSVNFTGMTSLTKMEAQAAGFNTAGIGAFSQAVEVSVP